MSDFLASKGINSMNSEKVQQIICDLIDELCALIPAERMPYIHLGSDEVNKQEEIVHEDFLIPDQTISIISTPWLA